MKYQNNIILKFDKFDYFNQKIELKTKILKKFIVASLIDIRKNSN